MPPALVTATTTSRQWVKARIGTSMPNRWVIGVFMRVMSSTVGSQRDPVHRFDGTSRLDTVPPVTEETIGRPRPLIAALPTYRPGKGAKQAEQEHGITDAIKLASNENPDEPLEAIVAAVAEAAH